jgi:hypothetical protein
MAKADYGVTGEEQPTDILRKLRAGKFVISVEVDPPRSFTARSRSRAPATRCAWAPTPSTSPTARWRACA